MKRLEKHCVTVPQIGLIALKRAMRCDGLALLLGDRLSSPQRRAIGWTLFAVGLVSTAPPVAEVLDSDRA